MTIASSITEALLSIPPLTGPGTRARGTRSSLLRGVKLLRYLEREGRGQRMAVPTLAFTFDVSVVTIERDIAALIRAGEPISRAKGEVWFEALAVRAVAMPPHREI